MLKLHEHSPLVLISKISNIKIRNTIFIFRFSGMNISENKIILYYIFNLITIVNDFSLYNSLKWIRNRIHLKIYFQTVRSVSLILN